MSHGEKRKEKRNEREINKYIMANGSKHDYEMIEPLSEFHESRCLEDHVNHLNDITSMTEVVVRIGMIVASECVDEMQQSGGWDTEVMQQSKIIKHENDHFDEILMCIIGA